MILDGIPLWAFFVGTIVIILVSVEAGYALERWIVRESKGEKESPVAAMGGAVLGLVAFMLAFTFSIAAGRFDTRKGLVRDDANAICTAWLRADFLPQAQRDEVRGLLREYLDARIGLAESKDVTKVPEVQAQSSAIQKRLWESAVVNGWRDNSDISALYVESINEVINVSALRVAVAVDTRVPVGVWIALLALTVLGMMCVGYQTAIAGSKRSWTSVMLAFSFALVFTLIAGLDRPYSPLVTVTQKPLQDVRAFMEHPARLPRTSTPAPRAPTAEP
jgi:hypothetical protein